MRARAPPKIQGVNKSRTLKNQSARTTFPERAQHRGENCWEWNLFSSKGMTDKTKQNKKSKLSGGGEQIQEISKQQINKRTYFCKLQKQQKL